MTSYDAGSAAAKYLIDYSQAEQAAKKIRELWQGIAQSQAQASRGGGGSSGVAAAARATGDASAANLRYANSLAAVQRAQGNLNGVAQSYRDVLATLTPGTIAYNNALAKLVNTENQIAKVGKGGLGPPLPRTFAGFTDGEAAKEFSDGIKNGLLGIVGPAAIASAAIGGVQRAAQSFKDAFAFKSDLDATTRAITTNIGETRNSGRVFAEAAAFADKYRLTQRETADILAASTDTLRTSTASVGDLESALLRLQSRDVSKPVSEAARALRELQSGDVTSIKELFNVPAKEALRMRDEIVAGGDAVKVLNDYLNRAGVSMEVLSNRSKGVAGALNEQKIAAENLALAQANIASSSGGILLVQEQARVYQGLANLLNGDVVGGYRATAAELSASIVKNGAYNAALNAGKTEAEAAAIAEAAYAAQINIATKELNGGVDPNLAYANSLNVVADSARNAAHELARVADGKSNNGQRTIGPSASSGLLALAQGRQQTAADIAAGQTRYNQLKLSELQIAYAGAKTDAQKIAILRQELQYTDTQIGKNSILAQIEGLKNSTAKGVASAYGKQRQEAEGTFDAINKQKDALLDIQELTIKDRQSRRDEDAKLRTAQRILDSPTQSAEAKARAQDAINLINVERAKRQQQIIEKGQTAGGSIINGKLFQSIPGGGAAPGVPSVPTAGAAAGAAAAPAAGGRSITLRLVDSAGKVIAETVEPIIMDALVGAIDSVLLQKGL